MKGKGVGESEKNKRKEVVEEARSKRQGVEENSRSKRQGVEENSRSKGQGVEENSRSKRQGVEENSRSKTQGVEENSRSNKKRDAIERIIAFCQEPHTLQEIAEELGFSDRYWMKKHYIDPLLGNTLQMTSVESKNAPTQKYIAIRTDS